MAFVNRTYHTIVTDVENDITPQEVCQKIGLCRSSIMAEPIPSEALMMNVFCDLSRLAKQSEFPQQFIDSCSTIYSSHLVCQSNS